MPPLPWYQRGPFTYFGPDGQVIPNLPVAPGPGWLRIVDSEHAADTALIAGEPPLIVPGGAAGTLDTDHLEELRMRQYEKPERLFGVTPDGRYQRVGPGVVPIYEWEARGIFPGSSLWRGIRRLPKRLQEDPLEHFERNREPPTPRRGSENVPPAAGRSTASARSPRDLAATVERSMGTIAQLLSPAGRGVAPRSLAEGGAAFSRSLMPAPLSDVEPIRQQRGRRDQVHRETGETVPAPGERIPPSRPFREDESDPSQGWPGPMASTPRSLADVRPPQPLIPLRDYLRQRLGVA